MNTRPRAEFSSDGGTADDYVNQEAENANVSELIATRFPRVVANNLGEMWFFAAELVVTEAEIRAGCRRGRHPSPERVARRVIVNELLSGAAPEDESAEREAAEFEALVTKVAAQIAKRTTELVFYNGRRTTSLDTPPVAGSVHADKGLKAGPRMTLLDARSPVSSSVEEDTVVRLDVRRQLSELIKVSSPEESVFIRQLQARPDLWPLLGEHGSARMLATELGRSYEGTRQHLHRIRVRARRLVNPDVA